MWEPWQSRLQLSLLGRAWFVFCPPGIRQSESISKFATQGTVFQMARSNGQNEIGLSFDRFLGRLDRKGTGKVIQSRLALGHYVTQRNSIETKFSFSELGSKAVDRLLAATIEISYYEPKQPKGVPSIFERSIDIVEQLLAVLNLALWLLDYVDGHSTVTAQVVIFSLTPLPCAPKVAPSPILNSFQTHLGLQERSVLFGDRLSQSKALPESFALSKVKLERGPGPPYSCSEQQNQSILQKDQNP
eukprot:TRINITY_DN8237_c3_g1_i1.p1 TRINITY_DN8237_c3_g1~~TRINITY_DN8237_c3_g1_i1.p1  ORF type:complete len:245 (+),score=3.89 TRINITY_DN8237_c3_g1_i1:206-940(+)